VNKNVVKLVKIPNYLYSFSWKQFENSCVELTLTARETESRRDGMTSSIDVHWLDEPDTRDCHLATISEWGQSCLGTHLHNVKIKRRRNC